MGLMKAIAPLTRPSPAAAQLSNKNYVTATKRSGLAEAANDYDIKRKASKSIFSELKYRFSSKFYYFQTYIADYLLLAYV